MCTIFIVAPLVALAACVSAAPALAQQPVVEVTPPQPQVPAPLAETQPLPPVSGAPLTWQPGHWDYSSMHQYEWVKGAWVQRGSHTLWQPEYWALENGGWVWVPGHWL